MLTLVAVVTGVVDEEEDNPVAGTGISIPELGVSAPTDPGGTFAIGVDVGEFTLKLFKAGHLSAELIVS
ncbi:MAG: hypothetical protein DRO40_13400 [Thermoprotei archaeon]|nr:MAG: hypothetical protein DRO40_13400 [Thermoprotei archaeon]